MSDSPPPPEPASGAEPPADSPAGILAESAGNGNRIVPRVVSLIMLLAVVLLVAAVFFRVMAQFIAPLFLAGVLVVIFEPLHKRVMRRLPGRNQIAALVTTTIVALSVVLPSTWLGLNAFAEIAKIVSEFKDEQRRAEITAQISERAKPVIDWYERTSGQDFETQAKKFGGHALEMVVETGVDTVLAVIGFLFGLGILLFAMYYFFADGPGMVEAFVRLSPLDDAYERELLEKFSEVSRAVVIATLLSAVAQGLLAGIGYYFCLDGGPIFLLTAATMLMAIVPFVGATIVWVPVVAWVYFYQQDPWVAGGLLAWCMIPVSNIDNIIKPLVLHGQSNLHPLLALLSVLGGVTVLGPVGILVGPMLVAFLQALLNMLRKELKALGGEPDPEAPDPVAPKPEPPAADQEPPPPAGDPPADNPPAPLA